MTSLYDVLDFLFAMCMPIIGISVICAVVSIGVVCFKWIEDYYYYDYVLYKPTTEENKINFYHPRIQQTYYELLENENKTKKMRRYLIKQNNYLNQYHLYNNMEDRLKQIENNREMQTVFLYVELVKCEQFLKLQIANK
jgi:hypothetical protein